MAITITRDQREALYQEVMTDLTSARDIVLFLEDGDYDKAREYRQRFEGSVRLLDDIGWEPDDDRDEFPLTMPGHELARLMRRINEASGAMLHIHIVEPDEEREHAARSLLVQTTCGDVLAQIADVALAGEGIDGR